MHMYMLMALINFALIGDGAYEGGDINIITNLSKLDLERLILVLRTHFVHITSRIHQNCDRILPYFWS